MQLVKMQHVGSAAQKDAAYETCRCYTKMSSAAFRMYMSASGRQARAVCLAQHFDHSMQVQHA